MTNKRALKTVLFSISLFALPAINLLDIFPDFLGYFLLAALLSHSQELVPYLSEARGAALKLGFITLARLPVTVITYVNLHTGTDIVPLFTLVFAILETVFLYQLITNAFSGLFYIGQRTEASAILNKITLFKRDISPEGVRRFTLIFAFLRAALNFIPELCLLTSQEASVNRLTTILYPILLISAIVISLFVGIIWYIVASRYARSIAKEDNIREEVKKMVGEEKLLYLASKRRTRQITGTLTLLAAASLFTLDISFKETGGVNILPHFIYGLLILYVAIKLFDSRKLKISLICLTSVFTVLSLISYILTVNYYDSYTLLELLERSEAKLAYIPIMVMTVLEGVSLIALLVLMALGMRTFILKNTGIEVTNASYSTPDRDRHSSLTIRAYVLFGITALITLLKVLKVLLDAGVKPIFSETGIILSSGAPWLFWVYTALSLGLTLFSFFYLSELKAEVRFKYDTELSDTRRGEFE